MMLTHVVTAMNQSTQVLRHVPMWLRCCIDQLVVVDYGSSDDTTARLLRSKYSKDPRLFVVQVGLKTSGPFLRNALARNIGALASNYEYLMFTDALTGLTAHGRKSLSTMLKREFPPQFVRHTDHIWNEPCIVHNAAFYSANGFDVTADAVVGLSDDLAARAVSLGFSSIDCSDWFNSVGHTDLNHFGVDDSEDARNDVVNRSKNALSENRAKTKRANPGKTIRSMIDLGNIRMFNRGRLQLFCRDD
jgi:hypothetical protein